MPESPKGPLQATTKSQYDDHLGHSPRLTVSTSVTKLLCDVVDVLGARGPRLLADAQHGCQKLCPSLASTSGLGLFFIVVGRKATALCLQQGGNVVW